MSILVLQRSWCGRELVALLRLSSWCLVMVEWLFLAVPWGCFRFVIMVFPDHTNLLFSKKIQVRYILMVNPYMKFKNPCLLSVWTNRKSQSRIMMTFNLSNYSQCKPLYAPVKCLKNLHRNSIEDFTWAVFSYTKVHRVSYTKINQFILIITLTTPNSLGLHRWCTSSMCEQSICKVK